MGQDREFRLRMLAAQDAPALHAIHCACLTRTLSAHYTPAQLAAWMKGRSPEGYLRAAADGERFVVAETAGDVVGFASSLGDELMALYVHPDAQGRGIGTRLFASAGEGVVRLKAARGAEAFYARRGFIAEGRGATPKHDEKIEFTLMVLAAAR